LSEWSFSLSDLKTSFNFLKNDGVRFFFPLPRKELNREGDDGGDTLGKTSPFVGVAGKGDGLCVFFSAASASHTSLGEALGEGTGSNGTFAMSPISSWSATAVVPLSDLASAIEASPTST
jgi:hypothetical protein